MQVEELELSGVKLITVKQFLDDRGFFREIFRKPLYAECGITCEFVQDNHSFSRKNTLRGMHFQRSPGQAKLVSVMQGIIYDVVVDMRTKRWLGVYLDAKEGQQLFVPPGYAHGFCVISEEAHIYYKVSSIYNPKEEMIFRFDDPQVNITWPISSPILSERDKQCLLLEEVLHG